MPANSLKIVFLIDEQSLVANLINLEQLRLCIMRILIFYSTLVDQQPILWGFRFFSTKTRYTATSIRRFYNMTKDSLNNIEQEYRRREEERPAVNTSGKGIIHIQEALKETIGDFQWESESMSTDYSANNHVFILTNTPSCLSEIPTFFPLEGKNTPSIEQLSSFNPHEYFKEYKEELVETLSESYLKRRISISIIDTTFKHLQNSPIDENLQNSIYNCFKTCLDLFDGVYIPFQSLIRTHDIYGHSFISEFVNVLPSEERTASSNAFIPIWKGEFKTIRGKLIGQCSLYPSRRNGHYNLDSLAYMSELQVCSAIRTSQFSLSWLIKDPKKEEQSKFKLVYEDGGSHNIFNSLLEELFNRQEVLIAEFIPLPDSDASPQKVCIEPYSRLCASVQFINMIDMPQPLNENLPVLKTSCPIGTHYKSIKLNTKLPETTYTASKSSDAHFTTNLPDFIKTMVSKQLEVKQERLDSALKQATEQLEEEEVTERIVALPPNVNRMGKDLKHLYLEALYTQNDTMENVIIIIDKWIEHLLNKNHTKEEILETLFDYSMPSSDLEIKHTEELTRTLQLPPRQLTSEQRFQQAWWNEIRMYPHYNSHYEKMCRIALKAKEAQLQVILYCFMCKLITDLPPNTLRRDPALEAEDFFTKMMLMFSMNDLGDFLAELDSEEDANAIKLRDPCDLSDLAFAKLLEERFPELKELIEIFNEATGIDDMESIVFSDDDFELGNDLNKEKGSEIQQQKQPKLPRQTSSHSLSTTKSLLEQSTSKLSSHSNLNRMNSNPLDNFLKRTVDVNQSSRRGPDNTIGEAARDAMGKIKRSLLDGHSDMMRAGSFMKSARKEEARPITNDEEPSGVVLRRKLTNEQLTPRSSLQRFFQTDIFDEYAESCPSPSSAADYEEYGCLRSEYPPIPPSPEIPYQSRRAAPRVPQPAEEVGEPEEAENVETIAEEVKAVEDDEEGFSYLLSDVRVDSPPEMDLAVYRRDLTAQFKSMYEEENVVTKDEARSRTRSFDEMFGEDDDEDEDDDDGIRPVKRLKA
ncbi:MAG: hypothetical protein EXX96DRAFT_579113 [Benjaminiella poitrasii]|nr:MAG: hypothetical protein EXX96DRAFT_579113 [Benjaminiella poitrasii]